MADDLELLALARDAATRAYAPYSDFAVGAAVQTASGARFTGCNVENASFGLTICAERNAIAAAAAAGHREIVAVAVAAPTARPVTPCGACRQVLNEFVPADREMIVILDDPTGPERVPLSELLPRGFGRADLPEQGQFSSNQ